VSQDTYGFIQQVCYFIFDMFLNIVEITASIHVMSCTVIAKVSQDTDGTIQNKMCPYMLLNMFELMESNLLCFQMSVL